MSRAWQFTALVAGLFLLALVATALHKSWSRLFPEVAESVALDPTCNLRQGPCTRLLPGGGSVRFSISPPSIPVMQKLQLEVRTAGVSVTAVQVDFVGVDMDMGFNRHSLPRQQDGRFAGEAVLPVCVRKRMDWEARVLLDTGGGLVSVPFRFHTLSPSAL